MASTILSELQRDITAVRDSGAGAAELVTIMPYPVADILSSSEKLTRYVNVGQFSHGGVNIDVLTFNGIPMTVLNSQGTLDGAYFKERTQELDRKLMNTQK